MSITMTHLSLFLFRVCLKFQEYFAVAECLIGFNLLDILLNEIKHIGIFPLECETIYLFYLCNFFFHTFQLFQEHFKQIFKQP